MKFLFCEDDSDAVVLFVRSLAQEGFFFTHVWVQTKEQFIEEMPSSDILFVDCSLPNFTCDEALSLWTQHGKMQPFIILSGTINSQKGVLLKTLGATDFVLKDNLVELGIVTTRALEAYKLKGELKQHAVDGKLLHSLRNSLTIVAANVDYMLHVGEFNETSCKAIQIGVQRMRHTLEGLDDATNKRVEM